LVAEVTLRPTCSVASKWRYSIVRCVQVKEQEQDWQLEFRKHMKNRTKINVSTIYLRRFEVDD